LHGYEKSIPGEPEADCAPLLAREAICDLALILRRIDDFAPITLRGSFG